MRRREARTVAVVGAGFSGLLTALHLLEADPHVTVRLIERAQAFGRGRAYAASQTRLLNVRAANMSAFPERPDHFQAWLAKRGEAADRFVSRGLYGGYLQGLLRDATCAAGRRGRLLLESDEVERIDRADGGFRLRLAMGRVLLADAVVLALGLGPPDTPPGVTDAVAGHPAYVADPWRVEPDASPTGEILLLGSGLTMVDVLLDLDRPDRRFIVLSRRGLLPLAHGPSPPGPLPPGDFGTVTATAAHLRRHARDVGWRTAVDSLRPVTPAIWRAWPQAQRERFLRHARPWWDVHRHRLAPELASRVAGMRDSGRLQALAGRLERVEVGGAGLAADIRLRGAKTSTRLTLGGLVNCTGPSGRVAAQPLLAQLAAAGLARGDRLGLGLDVDDDFRVRGRDGAPVPGLFAVGPLARAARWETVAVPDIRNHAAEVARIAILS